jgi:DNA topoisomerase II
MLRFIHHHQRKLSSSSPTNHCQVSLCFYFHRRFFTKGATKLGKASNTNNTLTRTNTEQYTRLDPISHVLLRPGMYVGSITRTKQQIWLPSSGKDTRMILQDASYIPALYKIFDEIIVNAADNYQRDSKMTSIDVVFNSQKNTISVRNDGKGIPVRLHEAEQVYVPELVLGNLLTGSNFDDTKGRLTGGAHGFGAKLTNIFSTNFTVETADTKRKLLYKQTWTDNMRERGEPDIIALPDNVTNDYTKVSFTPDFPRFGMKSSSEFWKLKGDDTLALMVRRVWDVAGVNSELNITIDGTSLDINSFLEYVGMFGEPIDNELEKKEVIKPLYLRPNRHWELVVGSSTDAKFQQVSFVNSISTLRGGTHVNIMVEQLCRRIADYTNRVHGKSLSSTVTPNQVRNHLKIFVNALIENPAFDSQLKESLTTPSTKFGSNPVLSERFTKLVIQKSGVVESVVNWSLAKEKVQFLGQMKTNGRKSSNRLMGIPKLEDANDAGDSELGRKCTLILTEGDSAKALAVAGLAVVGRDKYGVFPLRGKPLNVRDASLTQIGNNEEIKNLIQILGLDYNKNYDNEDDYNTLRYGSIMIMADQDHDGSHIKGLLLNALHCLFPQLLERKDFVKAFITPIVKVKKKKSKNEEIVFYTLAEYEKWKKKTFDSTNSIDTTNNWNIKYYKGLGTSTAEEARVYFNALEQHVVTFEWGGMNDGERLDMAFRKSRAEDRKKWLSRPLKDELKEDHQFLKAKTVSSFVDNELVLFSHADNIRSIPSIVDGLKPSQRKVLYACFKRKLISNEIKVAQLAGYISEHTAYHHGEASLQSTIINMAQNFVGSNNLPLLYPSGQFGTRLQGGKDAASPRYVFTKLMKYARNIFPVEDDPLLEYRDDDGYTVEPVYYVPIIPMALVNGCDGIGTGWSTSIPMYNPIDLIEWIENKSEYFFQSFFMNISICS